jgi:predicted DNA-binding transcriptional regulator AlpA
MEPNLNRSNTCLDAGLLRLDAVLKLIPVSKSGWWAGVDSGRYPKPVKLGPRITAWKASDIRDLIEHGIKL